MTQPTDSKKRKPRLPMRLLAILGLSLVGGLIWWGLRPAPDATAPRYTGYVVSENLYMASPVSGTLTSLAVVRGQRVAAGTPLFSLDPTVRAAADDSAQAQTEAARAQLRQQEALLVQAQADIRAAQADADKAATQLNRLVSAQGDKAGAVAQTDIDQAQAAVQAARARQEAARARQQSATAAIASAQAQVAQAQAGRTSAQQQLKELSPVAPSAGRVENIMYRPGESVSANMPVIAIVPDAEVKVRFYVPETQVNGFQVGRRVRIGCDGCAKDLGAVVDFVATRPEYTPPVIYSLEARQKLVFMIEAVPSAPTALTPGQPVDITPDTDTDTDGSLQ